MAELKKGKSNVTLIGKVKLSEKSFQGIQSSKNSDYQYVRINFGVEVAENSTVYCELMGGYSPSNPIIYGMDKENNPTTINWADRLNENIIDSMADFKLHKAGVTRKEDGTLDMKKFLSPIDLHEHLKESLKDGMEVIVRGSMAFSEYNDETQRKLTIQNVYIPNKKDEAGNLVPVQYGATFTQTFLLNEDSFKKVTASDKKDGEVIISALAVDYVSKKNGKPFKKNVPFPVALTYKLGENIELSEKILSKLFKVKKDTIRELTIQGNIVEGYEEGSVSSKDIELSAEIKELIEMGLYSEEEAKASLTVRGNKVSKLVFVKPHIENDKNDASNKGGTIALDDTKYKPQDLFVAEEDTTSNDDDLSDVEDISDDSSWLTALGV